MTGPTKWIVTADERKAMLHCCQMQHGGRWRIETKDSVQNKWEDYHEHHRPNVLGRGPTANAAQHYAASEQEPEEEHRRFAKDVANWLARARQELGIERMDIFAAPRFLGLLRTSLGYLDSIAHLHQSELTRVPVSDLATHPAVARALGSQAGFEQLNR